MTVAISCCLWRFPISDRDPDCMEKLGYTDTETLLWDYSETELYHVLVIPPARARRTLYRITPEYAFQWFGLNGQNNLTVVYYPFSQVNFRNLTDPCICPPEADAFTATVTVSPSSVLEDGGVPLVFTIRLDRISASDATIDFTLAGSAIEGVDYTTVAPHSVTISAGALTADVSVDPLIDLLFESTESVTMALTSGVSGPGLIDVTGAMATGFIIETMAPPLPSWQRPLSVVPEAPIWHHVRTDQSSFATGTWISAGVCLPWRPTMLSTTKLWLKGEDNTGSDGSSITTWTDASGNGNNATGVSGPTVDAADLNGINTVRLNAVSLQYFTLPNFLTAFTAGSVVFVVKNFQDPTFPFQDAGVLKFGNDGTINANNHFGYTADNIVYEDFGQASRLTANNPTTSLAQWNIGSFRADSVNWQFYLNGISEFVTSSLGVAWNTTPKIGRGAKAASENYYNGWIAEIIFNNESLSTANRQKLEGYLAHKWGLTGNLAVEHPYKSAAPTTCDSTGCDPYWDDVVLQLSFDDVNGAVGPFSPGFIDESSHAHGTMFTTFGGEISTAQSVFGGSSGRYLGGGHRSTYGDDVDWNLSTRLFTIEYRFRPVSTAFGFHLGQWPSFAGDLGWILYSDTSYSMNISTTGSDNITVFASAAGVFTVDTWHACCVDFDGIKYRAYVNGVMVASSTTLRTIRNSSTLFSIGAGSTGSFSCNCYIDELRITMDRARYASDSGYTVANQPFPEMSCGAAAFPSYVNNGGITQSTSVHTATLPGSLVGGNLLILYFKVRSTTNDPTVSAGWTLIDSIIGGGTYRYGAYYCYVNGAQTAPTLTWAGGGQAVSAIVQYQDAKSVSPTVVGTKNSAQTGTTISTTAITSTADKSLAISFSWDDAALAPTLPSGFTTEAPEGTFQNVFGSMRLCDKQLAVTGTSSGAVSCTQAASVPWGTILFELKAA